MKALLIACAILAASSSCFADATAIGDCKKRPTPKQAIMKKILRPPLAASAPASAPAKKKSRAKIKVLPAAELIDCPPIVFPPSRLSTIPPPDEDGGLVPIPLVQPPVALPLVMTVTPLIFDDVECFCTEAPMAYAPVGYYDGGGGSYYVPVVPLPPTPEPTEWLMLAAGLAALSWRRR